MSGYY